VLGSQNAQAAVVVRAPLERVLKLLQDFEKWLRFNPVWDELEILEPLSGWEKGSRGRVRLRLEGEKAVRELVFEVEEASLNRVAYRLSDGGRIEIQVRELDGTTELLQRGGLSAGDVEELELWLRALKHYAELRSTPPARLTKLLIDRLLLRLNPMQRRLVMLVLLLQLGLLAISLLAIAVVYLRQLTRA